MDSLITEAGVLSSFGFADGFWRSSGWKELHDDPEADVWATVLDTVHI